MPKAALKVNSTQKFIEILDIADDIVILSNGNACIIIEVQATNFDLLSQGEQDARIYSYSSLLNSLSFPIQVIIRSKQLDISAYLSSLGVEAKKTTNQGLANQINLYKDFVSDLIKINTVLDKHFYIIIPYSSLEKGISGGKQAVGKNSMEAFSQEARASLHSKAESIHTQLRRINLKAETLEKDKLVKLYYEIFNDGLLDVTHSLTSIQSPIVKGKGAK